MYLDNAATTPLTKEVKDYIISLLDMYENPSSGYESGHTVKLLINSARERIAQFINAESSDNIYFTCGGSASNTLAIKGLLNGNPQEKFNIYYSPIAHKSIQKCMEHYDNAIKLSVDKYGVIDIDNLKLCLEVYKGRPFVIIDYANSEIGTIQDVEKIIELTHQYNGIVYLDCTGTIPYIQIDVQKLDVDMIGFSAHKLGALKGTGVLYKKSNINIEPLIYGAQEQGLFGGTENVLGICALSKAIEHYNYSYITSKNRDYVYEWIIKNISDVYLIGSYENRLSCNLYMCFQGVKGESLMILLDNMDIQTSTGSACNMGNPAPSQTLLAIGVDKKDINSCLRISFSGDESQEELINMCNTLKQAVAMLRSVQ